MHVLQKLSVTRYAHRLQRPNLRKTALKTTAAKVDYVAQEKVGPITLPAPSVPSAFPHIGCACIAVLGPPCRPMEHGPRAAMQTLLKSVACCRGTRTPWSTESSLNRRVSSRSIVRGLTRAPCSQPLPRAGASCASGSCLLCCRQPRLGMDKPRIRRVWTSTALVVRTLPDGSLCPQATGFCLTDLNLVAGKQVSPWHDIPLWAEEGKLLNFICEIPKETSAKMEVGASAQLAMMAASIRTSARLKLGAPAQFSVVPAWWSIQVAGRALCPSCVAGLALAGHVLACVPKCASLLAFPAHLFITLDWRCSLRVAA